MKRWPLYLAIIILVTLQLTWPRYLVFFRCRPDILLVFAVSLVFYLDFKIALMFAILLGLAKDIFLPSTLAINSILFSIWSYLIYRASRQISTDNFYVRLAIVFIVVFLNNIIMGLKVLNSANIVPFGIFLRNLIIIPIYSALLAPLIFKFTKKITA